MSDSKKKRGLLSFCLVKSRELDDSERALFVVAGK
jgi:hypothetical protein